MSIYPCGYCKAHVGSLTAGVCCDDCSIWFHETCVSVETSLYEDLQQSNVSWLCNRCDYTNTDINVYHSYELTTSDQFEALNSISGTSNLSDSSGVSVFSPNVYSTPI